MATPRPLTPSELIDLCLSPTLARAAEAGDGLGWRRLAEAELAEWRSSFIRAFPGTSLEIVGWRRGSEQGDGQLSFWVARGGVSHRACAYGARDATGLIEALSARFGAPDLADKTEVGNTAFWKRDKIQAAFSQVGAAFYVNISQTD